MWNAGNNTRTSEGGWLSHFKVIEERIPSSTSKMIYTLFTLTLRQASLSLLLALLHCYVRVE